MKLPELIGTRLVNREAQDTAGPEELRNARAGEARWVPMSQGSSGHVPCALGQRGKGQLYLVEYHLFATLLPRTL